MSADRAALPRSGSAAKILDALRELEGSTLEWWALAVTHAQFRLLSSRLPRGVAEIAVVGLLGLSLPAVMHRVRFSLASDEKVEQVRAALDPRLAHLVRPGGVLLIDCDEGCFWICSQGRFSVRWRDVPDTSFLDQVNRTHWPPGLKPPHRT